MNSIITILIIAGSSALIAWLVVKIVKHTHENDPFYKVDPPNSYEKIGEEWEVATVSGARYRSEEGIIWYSFPGGYRAQYGQNGALEKGLERHKRIEKWSKA